MVATARLLPPAAPLPPPAERARAPRRRARARAAPATDTPTNGPADRAAPRTDQNSMTAHAQLLEKAKHGRIDVYFEGDSIVRRWGALDYSELLANWRANFFGGDGPQFGWGGARTPKNPLGSG